MKVGILTYHRAINYGAYLQACALCGRLNEEDDIQAEIIDFRMDKEAKKYSYNWSLPLKIAIFQQYRFFKARERAFLRALNDKVMVKSETFLQSDKMEEFQKFVKDKYDVIIAGSDEIWNFNNFRGFPNPYWLISDLGGRKFSYAASSRQNFSTLSEKNRKIIERALKEFEFIGVRDELTKTELEKLVPEKSISLCCDPSFLFDFQPKKDDIVNLLRNKKGFDTKKRTIVVMADNEKLKDYLYQAFHKEFNMVSVCSYSKHYINQSDLTPTEWLNLINNADYVFTTFFHGTCFSMVCGVPFISFGSTARSSKVEAVLKEADLMGHYISNTDEMIGKMDRDILMRNAGDLSGCSDYVKKQREGFQFFLKHLKGEQ